MRSTSRLCSSFIKTLGWVLFCSLLVLGLDCYVVSQFYDGFSPQSNNLGVATAVLSLVFISPILASGMLGKNGPLTMVAVDLGVVFFIMILWLTTGAYTASQYACSGFDDLYGCGPSDITGSAKAAGAFAFLAFFALLPYWGALLACSILAAQRGDSRIWTTSIPETDFAGVYPQHPKETHTPKQYGQAHPPVTQYTGGSNV